MSGHTLSTPLRTCFQCRCWTTMTDKRSSYTTFEEFTWRIENFSKLSSEKLYSDTFIIDDFKWRILIFPRENNANYLSIYLVAGNFAKLPIGWKKFARFKIKLVHQVNSKMDMTIAATEEGDYPFVMDPYIIYGSDDKSMVIAHNWKFCYETGRHFSAEHNGWGKIEFISLSQLHDPANGYLLEDTCIIAAGISVNEPAVDIVANRAVAITTPVKSNGQLGPKKVETPQEEDQGEDVKPSASLSQVNNIEPINLVDFWGMGQMEDAFVPLLEDVCLQHPSLIECQLKRTRNFSEWAFVALGRVLHFLRTKKRRDMNDDARRDLQILWDELKTFGFDLKWLEPRIQSALGMNTYLKSAQQVKRMKENAASLEMKMKSLKVIIAAVEIDLEIARRDLAKAKEGFEEKNSDDEIGY